MSEKMPSTIEMEVPIKDKREVLALAVTGGSVKIELLTDEDVNTIIEYAGVTEADMAFENDLTNRIAVVKEKHEEATLEEQERSHDVFLKLNQSYYKFCKKNGLM